MFDDHFCENECVCEKGDNNTCRERSFSIFFERENLCSFACESEGREENIFEGVKVVREIIGVSVIKYLCRAFKG
jgi:hypothetical protein